MTPIIRTHLLLDRQNYLSDIISIVSSVLRSDLMIEGKISSNWLRLSQSQFFPRFHGIVDQKGKVAILTEFLSFGDLFKYLQKHPNIPAQTAVG